MTELNTGPFVLGSEAPSVDALFSQCISALDLVAAPDPMLSDTRSFPTSTLTYRFTNLTVSGDAKIDFPDHLRDETLYVVVDGTLLFERGARLRTNIHLKLCAKDAVGDVSIRSFGAQEGSPGVGLPGRAADGADGADEGHRGTAGSNAVGGDGGKGGKGDNGLPGTVGANGTPGGNGEPGRSIYLFVERFQFPSSVSLLSEGADGGLGGPGQDGGNGGDGKKGGRGGNGGNGNLVHRAGNAGPGGPGGDAGPGAMGGSTGYGGDGGDGGNLTVLVRIPSGLPWISSLTSEPGRGAPQNLVGVGYGGHSGIPGLGGSAGSPGRNSVPGRSDGKPSHDGPDGTAPRSPASNGHVRPKGFNGQKGRRDGPRPATPHDLFELFGTIIQGPINV